MAIGLGRMFGFHFLENFNHPYSAISVGDFWRRWHISLSGWFRDYVYIPLGGNRRGSVRTCCNLMLVFVVCGLWHGAGWSFIAWGIWHGVFLIVEHFTRASTPSVWRPVRHLYVLMAVLIGWVLFRADTVSAAWSYMLAMGGAAGTNPLPVREFISTEIAVVVVFGMLLSFPFASRWLNAHTAAFTYADQWSWRMGVRVGLEAVAIIGLLQLSVAYLIMQTSNPFIYFRF